MPAPKRRRGARPGRANGVGGRGGAIKIKARAGAPPGCSARPRHGGAGECSPERAGTKPHVGAGQRKAKHSGPGSEAGKPSPRVEAGCYDFCVKVLYRFFTKSASVGESPGGTGVVISTWGRARQLKTFPEARPRHGGASECSPERAEAKSHVCAGHPEAKHNGPGSEAGKPSPRVEAGCYEFCVKVLYRVFTKSASVGGSPGGTGVAISALGRARQL